MIQGFLRCKGQMFDHITYHTQELHSTVICEEYEVFRQYYEDNIY